MKKNRKGNEMSDNVRVRREGGIVEVTLNRPKANAISLETSRAMGEVFRDFRDDPQAGRDHHRRR